MPLKPTQCLCHLSTTTCVVALLLIILFTFGQIRGGQVAHSQDNRFYATAMLVRCPILPFLRPYYEISLVRCSEEGDRLVKKIRIDKVLPVPLRKSERVIFWADDGNSVSFRFPTVQITMQVQNSLPLGS